MKLTSAQNFVYHTLLGLLFGALSSGATAGVQAIGSGGSAVNLLAVITAACIGFGAAFGRGFVTLEKSPQTTQALGDGIAQLTASHNAFIQRLDSLLPAFLQHTHPAPVQQQPVTPQPQVAQRPQFAAPVSPNSVVLPAVPTMLPQGQ